MTFDQAFEAMNKVANGRYFSLVFEKVKYQDGSIRVEVRGYLDKQSWSHPFSNFASVIDYFKGLIPVSTSEGINDGQA